MTANAPLDPVSTQLGYGTDVTHETWGVARNGTPVDILPENATPVVSPRCQVCKGILDGRGYVDSCRCGRRPVSRVMRRRS